MERRRAGKSRAFSRGRESSARSELEFGRPASKLKEESYASTKQIVKRMFLRRTFKGRMMLVDLVGKDKRREKRKPQVALSCE